MAIPNNAKIKRGIPTANTEDAASVDLMTYSRQSSSHKTTSVGPSLAPLYNGSAFTTDASAGITLPSKGCLLAFYNSDTSVHSVTLSTLASTTALAAGVTNTNGDVGVPVAAGTWLYLSAFINQFLIVDNNKLLSYIVQDDTTVTVSILG